MCACLLALKIRVRSYLPFQRSFIFYFNLHQRGISIGDKGCDLLTSVFLPCQLCSNTESLFRNVDRFDTTEYIKNLIVTELDC